MPASKSASGPTLKGEPQDRPLRAQGKSEELRGLEELLHAHFVELYPNTGKSAATTDRPHHYSKAEQVRTNVFSMVASSVSKKQMRENSRAAEAMDAEWARLRGAEVAELALCAALPSAAPQLAEHARARAARGDELRALLLELEA